MKKNGIALFIAFIFAFPAWADNFKFATLEFPPLEFMDSDGEVRGIAVDIVRKIMTNLGHTVDINIYPWARALRMTKNGDTHAIFTAYKNAEREAFLDYSRNVLVLQIVTFYVNKDSDITYDGDLMNLKDKQIGVVSTISYGTKFDRVREQLNIQRVENRFLNLKKLKAGRIDMMISNIYVGDSTIKKAGMQGEFKKISPPVQTVDSFIAFSKVKGLTTLRDKFDEELEKLIANGTYDKIMAKYGVEK